MRAVKGLQAPRGEARGSENDGEAFHVWFPPTPERRYSRGKFSRGYRAAEAADIGLDFLIAQWAATDNT